MTVLWDYKTKFGLSAKETWDFRTGALKLWLGQWGMRSGSKTYTSPDEVSRGNKRDRLY